MSDVGKGSGRRPGEGYAEGWDAIFKPKRECKCSLRIKLVGDGCDRCNPPSAAQLAEWAKEDEEGAYDMERES